MKNKPHHGIINNGVLVWVNKPKKDKWYTSKDSNSKVNTDDIPRISITDFKKLYYG